MKKNDSYPTNVFDEARTVEHKEAMEDASFRALVLANGRYTLGQAVELNPEKDLVACNNRLQSILREASTVLSADLLDYRGMVMDEINYKESTESFDPDDLGFQYDGQNRLTAAIYLGTVDDPILAREAYIKMRAYKLGIESLVENNQMTERQASTDGIRSDTLAVASLFVKKAREEVSANPKLAEDMLDGCKKVANEVSTFMEAGGEWRAQTRRAEEIIDDFKSLVARS